MHARFCLSYIRHSAYVGKKTIRTLGIFAPQILIRQLPQNKTKELLALPLCILKNKTKTKRQNTTNHNMKDPFPSQTSTRGGITKRLATQVSIPSSPSPPPLGTTTSTTTTTATTNTSKVELLQKCAKSGVTKRLGFTPLGVTPIPTQVAIGVASASYWRGMWYILDDNLFPENPTYSAMASLGLGSFGLAFIQGAIAKKAEYYAKKEAVKLPSYYPSIARFGTLYCVATSCILVWRGAWMGWDIAYEKLQKESATDKGHLTISGIGSHVIATLGLLAFGRFSSVLGPPARVSILEDLAFKATTWQQYSKSAKWFFK